MDVHCKSYASMQQSFRNDLGMYALLECQTGKPVRQIVESDILQAHSLRQSGEVVAEDAGVKRLAFSAGEDKIIKAELLAELVI